MSQHVQTLNESTFDEAIMAATDKPLVVDFWADWCGPCKALAPILDEIAEEQKEAISIAKLNVDEAPEVARRYDVMSIPTLIVFKDGKASNRLVGALSKNDLLSSLELV